MITNNQLLLNIDDTLDQISDVANILWQRGWAERNGGNFSINITQRIKEQKEFNDCPYFLDNRIPNKVRDFVFFVTGSGKRLRDLTTINKISQNAVIIKIDPQGSGYHVIWGGESSDFKPTSELSTHLQIHADLTARNINKTAVLHTHPNELISLSHSYKYCPSSVQLTNYLWKMLPEIRAFVPRGIALVPYTLPGSTKLAELTVEALRTYDIALWKKHGALAIGNNLIDAFDYIDVANKGALLFLLCLSSGFTPEGMTDGELIELEKTFGLS